MLRRTSINFINQLLKENSNWNVLDIGCGYTANKYAKTVADVQDLKEFYNDKNKTVKLIRDPKFAEVPYPVIMEPSLVIEYYSR